MDETEGPKVNPRKVRLGLAIIGLVLVVALVMMAVVESPAGKAVMFAIALTALVRAYLLARSLRSEGPGR
jgi:uncharacterized membrane protein